MSVDLSGFDPSTGSYATDPSVVDASGSDSSVGSGFDWSGLGDIFSSIGTAVSGTYRQVNAPTGPTVVRPGTVVYNPNTGQVVGGGFAGLGSNSLVLLAGAAILLVLLLRK